MEKIDTQSAIHIPISIPMDELQERLSLLPRLNFVHIEHSSEAQKSTDSVITLARKDSSIKDKLVLLANAGFHLYVVRDGVSSMVRHRRIPTLWKMSTDGELSVDSNGLFSRVESASSAGEPRLLVVFSSIASKMYTPSLMRHFEQNFSTIGKYVPSNTHILRIADFGSVVGSFYLNSISLPENENNIYEHICATAAKLGVTHENIVLYGTSKGGTAATFYSMRHGWRGVAVDPILSDEHYIRTYNDSHFTIGTFLESKQKRFAELVNSVHPEARMSVICSTRSPQFSYIDETLIKPFSDRFVFLNSENTEIKNHPDVGPKTLPHMLSQLNQHLAGLDVSGIFQTVW